MAAVCDVCGKGPGFGHNVSHSHRRTKRRFDPNIQRVRAQREGHGARLPIRFDRTPSAILERLPAGEYVCRRLIRSRH